MSVRFITFEGTEGGGKSTQIQLLADRLCSEREDVLQIREPGGTAIGEEIRHLLKHSESNRNMTSEAELLLMCASRAQLVREVIRPALDSGKVVLCDRFYDSSVAYQGYGRELDLTRVKTIIDFSVGETRPDLTLYLHVPVEVSEARRAAREAESAQLRDRFEEADRAFFERVEEGFQAISHAEPERVHVIEATGSIAEVQERIWACVTGRRNPVS